MRFAFFGDVVGRAGRDALAEHLPALRRQLAKASAEVCDGLGAGRTAEIFLNLIGGRSGEQR